MENTKEIKGYQVLEMDFFRLCRIRKIKYSAMLVLIYLRGLYCRFGKPEIYCVDKIIGVDLGLSPRQLNRIRENLQEKGVIEFKTSHGRGKATEYKILKTELAPILKPAKMSGIIRQNVRFYKNDLSTKTCQNVNPRVITSKERVTDKDIFNDTRPKEWLKKTLQNIGNGKY